MTTVNPPDLGTPRGFSHGVVRSGRVLALAGQNGHDPDGRLPHPGDLVRQFDGALTNLLEVVRHAGGTPEDVVKLVVYVRNVAEYRASREALGAVWRRHFGRYYPAMTLVGGVDFFDADAVVEVDGMAVLDVVDQPVRPELGRHGQ